MDDTDTRKTAKPTFTLGQAVVNLVKAHDEIRYRLDHPRHDDPVTAEDLQDWHDAICRIPALMTSLMVMLLASDSTEIERLATISDAPLH